MRRTRVVEDGTPRVPQLLTDGARQLLETGESGADFEVLALARDTAGLRALWHAVKDEILAAWIKNYPGSRPHGWWQYDAPEPERRRLGGTGTLRSAVMAVEPSLKFGLDLDFVDDWNVQYYNGRAVDIHGRPIGREFHEGDFVADAYDPTDPPTFESQASFLRRHGLLLRGEAGRLTAADFEPERVEPGDAEEETRR